MGFCRRPTSCALVPALLLTACATEPAPVDAGIETVIASIRAIDGHAHPMRPVPDGAPADTDFDALPLDGIPPFPIPWRLTPDNREWADVARALYGVAASDTAAIAAARQAALTGQGMRFASWALDAIGTDVMLANRISLGEGLPAERFRGVAFADPLLFPLDTRAEAERSPDTRSLFRKRRRWRLIYFNSHDPRGNASIWSIPATGGTPRRLVRFDDPTRPNNRVEWSYRRGHAYFVLTEMQSDVRVMEMMPR